MNVASWWEDRHAIISVSHGRVLDHDVPALHVEAVRVWALQVTAPFRGHLHAVDGQARGIVVRNMVTGNIECYAADAVVLATGGYGNAFYLSTNAKGCNGTAIWRAHKHGAFFANPCFTQIHPT